MGQTTDELIRLAHRVSRTPSRRELDMLLTTGERISMTLLAMCLESLGCPAISFTGSQSGIMTDSRHSDARILSVSAHRIEEELARGRVVIVAGFQGVSRAREITTLGRGGSDTTAVALAVRLGGVRCEIYTDVPGVLTADPRIVPGARPIADIGFDPMIVLSHLGGRVLFRRAVLLARKWKMPIEVRGTFTDEPGTRIPDRALDELGMRIPGRAPDEPGMRIPGHAASRGSASALSGTKSGPTPRPIETSLAPPPFAASGQRSTPAVGPGASEHSNEEEPMETDRILGIAVESPVHWIRIALPAPRPDPADQSAAADSLAPPEGSPSLLCFRRTQLPDGSSLVEFIALPGPECQPWLEAARWGPQARIHVERGAALVSLVGEGVVADGGVMRRALGSLERAAIPSWAIHTGTLSVSFVVPEGRGEQAARALHADLVERDSRSNGS